jgi:NAD+ synthase
MGQVEQMIRYTYWTSGCKGIVVGLSGGVDSAVAATFCCRAVGGKKVLGLTLPSGVTKPEDIADAAMLCNQLGMEHLVISIEPILRGFQAMPDFKGSAYLLGNLMARIRMTVLYYQANLDNTLVCGTSNRSEYMLGYCTKFGDNAADFQPLLHLFKTEIYDIAKELGIPGPIIRKKPSAGLWEGQSDEEEIGLTYTEIDNSLRLLEQQSWKAATTTEEKVLGLIIKSEHKRMVAPNLLTGEKKP